MSKIHLIAIGGSVMHNLALALHALGHQVTGSDDQIYEPAASRLKDAGLLPHSEGWDPDILSTDVDVVILGMHAKSDNPELKRAQELGLRIMSFPEYCFEMYKYKLRVVIAGSHGKTSTTAMLMHVLRKLRFDFDYLVGAQLNGFDTMVRFSDAGLSVLEGDEYLSSCLDLRPKILHYHPQIAVITGLAWDHFNVFPTWESYVGAFRSFISSLPVGATLIYFEGDHHLSSLVEERQSDLQLVPYNTLDSIEREHETILKLEGIEYPLQIFGRHNLQNLAAVLQVCHCLGISQDNFGKAIEDFKGAAKRLELIHRELDKRLYLDFAHSPSKVKATILAVSEKFRGRRLLVILELHTYSSLNGEFIDQYHSTTTAADHVILFIDELAVQIKRMALLKNDQIISAFGRSDIEICHTKEQLLKKIEEEIQNYDIILFLGSGSFGGLDIRMSAKSWLAT